MWRRLNVCGLSQLVFLLVVTLVALCAPWSTKSEPLPSTFPSEPLSSLSSEPGALKSTNFTASPTPPSLVATPAPYYGVPNIFGTVQGILHTENFIYMIDEEGQMRRCGPTPNSADCTLFNKLWVTKRFGGGGPMAMLNSSHIIATSSNYMV
jgi:hypothetical protein